jgi:hypothetical protein
MGSGRRLYFCEAIEMEEEDLIADGLGLQVYHQTVFGPCRGIAPRMSVSPADCSRISCFGVGTHLRNAGRSS